MKLDCFPPDPHPAGNELGCRLGQGYLLSSPAPAGLIRPRLERGRVGEEACLAPDGPMPDNVVRLTDARRPGWRHRGIAILLALGLTFVLLVASLSQSAISVVLNQFMPDVWFRYRAFTSTIFSMGLDVVLFGLLYLYLPHRKLRWRDILPGAIAGGILWEVAKRIFVLFLTSYLTVTNLLYGSVTALMAFLFWAYSTGLMFQFGAYLNVEYERY